ncbi:MAG: 16S rRNA processing protein RimM [Bacteroidetes bacterium]|nr:MAG: 16S rRNA processing protein RimM [Bacteroidota bacterium]
MNPTDDYFYLGRITKVHGNNGEITAYLDVDNPLEYASLDMAFLSINNALIPYFIESIKILNNKAFIAFEGIDDMEKASDLVKTELYLPLTLLPKLTGNKFYYHEVEGFTIVDKQFGEIGTLKEILDYPNQSVMQVFHNDKEVLIPVNDDIITKVDRESKTIFVNAPEGLIGIYLNA